MGRIVVGVDGSEGSRRAMLWAAREAAIHGSRLEVVHAYQPSRDVRTTGSAAQVEKLYDAAHTTARELVDGIMIAIEGVEVEGHALESIDPARTLIERSRGADMLVVSSRGRSNLTSLLLGSVSQQCAHGAECPVVIVRTDGDTPG